MLSFFLNKAMAFIRNEITEKDLAKEFVKISEQIKKYAIPQSNLRNITEKTIKQGFFQLCLRDSDDDQEENNSINSAESDNDDVDDQEKNLLTATDCLSSEEFIDSDDEENNSSRCLIN